jgi:glycosyltransferase involved in cell wall biosynthesis
MTESSSKTCVPWVLVAGGFHNHGGMDKANAALAKYLLQQNTTLNIVAHRVDSFFYEHPHVRVRLVAKPAGSFLLGGFLLNYYGRVIARRSLLENPSTRVVVNGGNCVWPGVNWVHYVHHAWCSQKTRGRLWFKQSVGNAVDRQFEKVSIQSAKIVLANSNRTRNDILRYLHVNPDRVHTVYLGSESTTAPAKPEERAAARRWLNEPENVPIVVFVGALGVDNRKGFDLLWSAWRHLCSRPGWDAILIVAGDGSGLATWKSKVEQSGLQNRVRFLGSTDRIAELLAAADLLVSPVRYEAYGLNVQEAICRGVPSLVSRDAGIAERYPDNLAPMLLADPNEVEDLIRKLLMWRANIPYWREQFEPLGAKLRNYSWADMASRIVSVVENDRTQCNEIVPESMIFDPQSWEHSTSVHSGHPIG